MAITSDATPDPSGGIMSYSNVLELVLHHLDVPGLATAAMVIP